MKSIPVLSVVRTLVLTCLVYLVLLCPAFSADPVEVTAAQVEALMNAKEAVIVFPLSPIEYNNLHIEGSVNIPMAQIPTELPKDKNQALVFYCLGRT